MPSNIKVILEIGWHVKIPLCIIVGEIWEKYCGVYKKKLGVEFNLL